MIKLFLASIMVTVSISSFALEVDTVGLRQKKFSLKEVCEEMGLKDLLMVSARDQVRVDCMGKYIVAMDFCIKKLKNTKDLTRGYVVADTKEVICEEGSDVTVKLPCVGAYRERCIDPKTSCLKIRPAFAFQHELYHFSEVENTLNCRYQAELKEQNLNFL